MNVLVVEQDTAELTGDIQHHRCSAQDIPERARLSYACARQQQHPYRIGAHKKSEVCGFGSLKELKRRKLTWKHQTHQERLCMHVVFGS